MVAIYTDYNLQQPIKGDILFEGVPYFLDIENYSTIVINKWFEEEHIDSSIRSYHPKNKFLIIQFDNIVGFVNILGKEFDVRSKKLNNGENGNHQFQTLLDDISRIYSKLSFNIRGTSYAKRETRYEYNLDDLDVFDYYYQLAYMMPANLNLDTLIRQCLQSPNTINVETSIETSLEHSKKISPNFYRNIGKLGNLGMIPNTHSLSNAIFPQMTYKKMGKRLLPLTVSNTSFSQTTNTTENRFLKYFLGEINALCIKLINQLEDVNLVTKAKKLQKKVGAHLANPFFKNIQRLTYVPSSSSVLLKKAGYKEIYYHFVQSKFAFTPILENQKKYALKYGLKNIASLYELWAFLKIADIVFGGKRINETFEGQVQKYGSRIGSYKWQYDNIELFYNKGYTKSNGGSYSVNLRPDISLNVNGQLYLLDAKYKFNQMNDQSDLLSRVVKPEDIHKMHSYLDAIPSAKTAIVIFPGSEFVFYTKEKNIDDVNNTYSSGVGAIPLLPNSQTDFERLKNLINGYLTL